MRVQRLSILVLLIPVSLSLGLVGLLAFRWSLRNGQFDDPEGDAERILLDVDDRPLPKSQTSVSTRTESRT